MRTDIAPKPTLLADYTPSNFAINSVYLDFDLSPKATTVRSTLQMQRNAPGPLALDGEDITLKSVSVDGKSLKRAQYRLTQAQLIIEDLPDSCTLEIETQCDPKANTTLMGLYVSGGRFCTQCEAQGFRRITYYLDRPDVLSVFTVKITASKDYPYLLANGNMVDSGELSGQRHFAVWEDPFPKPCYLFALVAGQFDSIQDSFTTMSGRTIDLDIFVDPGDASRAHYAMDALKRSMKWDEDTYGREYDLDRFMIVAVRDFNFGAMENKGLNIFNSALLLADAESATDMNFERIESVVAHEYFHNWTGNRITCRDWFQLCLKEGFTVFRDQEFSADQRGHAVQRIKDVRALRSRQFPEDAGPLAHPVRPDSYIKIDNFYTATVYEKGAELVRMLKTLLGAQGFRKGCDYYFVQFDGAATTIEQFLNCFEVVTDTDLSQFLTWYKQAGTPEVIARTERRSDDGLRLHLRQKTAPTPGQARKKPQVIPVQWQVVGDNGPLSDPHLTIMDKDDISININDIEDNTDVTLSLFQDFSAPIVLKHKDRSDREAVNDALRLMANDPNPFNRWEAGQSLARLLQSRMARALQSGRMPKVDPALRQYIDALGATLTSDAFDDNFKALVLSPPSDMEIQQSLGEGDPIAVHLAGQWLNRAISDRLKGQLLKTYSALQDTGDFNPDAISAGRRALKNRSLALLAAGQHPEAAHLAMSQFLSATNMTDELQALMTLSRLGGRRAGQSMTDFYEKWHDNPLVIDKWFALQGTRKHPEGAAAITALSDHDAYKPFNPNRARALLGNFAMNNPLLFHHRNGSGYRVFTEQVLTIDAINPQIAARLLGVFEIWRKLDPERQDLICAELQNVIAANPSKNLYEIASKIKE